MDRSSPSSSPSLNYNSSFTSSPFRSRAVTPRLGHRRYSLADPWQTPGITKQKRICRNSHISTKIDSNSPGYATRVVQYSEEQEKFSPSYHNHHSKYDKLGVFPIVHFFKKDLPCLKRKPEETIGQLNSSELSKYNTSEHNRMLLEKIIKTSPGNQDSINKTEVNAKSVLDALKEISRKRIQPNGEEFILNEDGKRMYVDGDNENNSRKRHKQTSQAEELSSVTLSSRNQSIDELIASHSSTEGYFSAPPKEKLIEKTITPQKPKVVAVKYVDVETQTAVPQQPITPQPVAEAPTIRKETNTPQEPKIKKTSPVKVFDETPLETMRRNRLSALMGSLTSNKAQPQKETDPIKSDDTSPSKPLVSILSGNTRSPHKSSKHVTFDLPEEEKSSAATTYPGNIPTSNNITLNFNSEPSGITKTSAAVALPIVSATVVDSTLSPKGPANNINEFSPTTQKEVNSVQSVLSNSITATGLNTSRLMFASTTASPQLPNSISFTSNLSSKPEQGDNIDKVKPIETVKDTSMSNLGKLTDTEKPNPTGGFKFELKTGGTETPKPSSPFTFVSPTTASNVSAASVLPPLVSDNGKSNTPTFSVPVSTLGQGTITFGDSGATKPFSINSPGSFSMSKNPTAGLSTTSTNFGGTMSLSNTFTQSPPTSSAANNSFMPNFGTKVSTPNFMSSAPASKPGLFSFGQMGNVTSVSTNLTSPSVTANDSSLKSQGGVSTTTTFNFTTATSAPAPMAFGIPKTTGSATSAPMAFGVPKTAGSTASTPAPGAFGVPKTTGSTSTPAPMAFGVSKTTGSTASPFNNANSFITSTTSATNVFSGSEPKPSTTNSFFFNSANTFNKTSSGFNDSSATPNFGTDGSTKSVFRQSVVPSFNTTTVANFGGSNNTLTPSTSGFGNVGTAPSQSNVFGGSFGTTEPPPYSLNANTNNFGSSNFVSNQKSGFGSNPSTDNKNNLTSSFGTSYANSFGATTTASNFNSSPSTFSTTPGNFGSTKTFGQTNNNNSTMSSAFNPSPFDKPAAAPNVEVSPFGSTNASFGSSNFSANSQPSQGNVFTFGTNTNTKPGIFSFGTSEPPKPLFNFQTENNSPGFSSNNNKGFGAASSTPSAFNALPTAQFNVPPTGMFNIGTGGSSTPSRSRTQYKIKRRT